MSFEKKSIKSIAQIHNCVTFASTVLATHKSERIAYQGESFAFIGFNNQNNTPSMPLCDAHLEGFFFLAMSKNTNYEL